MLASRNCRVSPFIQVYFPQTLRVVTEVKPEPHWRNGPYSESFSASLHGKARPKSPLKHSRSPGSGTSRSLKAWKAPPSHSPPGDLLHCTVVSAAPVFDLVHSELQSLSLGLKTTSSTYIKATLSALPRTWKTPFSKKQIHLVSRVSKRSGQIAFFFSFHPPYPFPCSVSVLHEANYTQGSWEQHPKWLFAAECAIGGNVGRHSPPEIRMNRVVSACRGQQAFQQGTREAMPFPDSRCWKYNLSSLAVKIASCRLNILSLQCL